MTDHYFEDYEPGRMAEFGSIEVTETEVVEFARRFDPQDMHADPVLAARTRFGGLIASGLHTISMVMRMFVDHYLPNEASLASPGVDEVRFPQPVRPGDTLRVRITTLESIPSRSKADRGMVRSRVEGVNQNGETVLTLTVMNIIAKRPDSV